jgi:23S rRNA-/tRNA-specific pseudouridylate synthase
MYWLDDKNGKESITEFERVSFNGKTSVVKCYPKTGRTHQIRIHLQYLGHPIVNDPLYNQPTVSNFLIMIN